MISVREGQEHILAQIAGRRPARGPCQSRGRSARVLADDRAGAVRRAARRQLRRRRLRGRAAPTFRTAARASSTWSAISRRAPCSPGRCVRGQAAAHHDRRADARAAPTPSIPRRSSSASGRRVRVGADPQGRQRAPARRGRRGRRRSSIERGTVLRPQELGLITSLGLWQVLRASPARASRCSRPATRSPSPARRARPGQIYDANRFALRGSIEQCGGQVLDLGIVPDVRDELRARLLEASAMADVVITSGGVSVGRLRPRQGRAGRDRRDRFLAGGACSPAGRWRSAASARPRSSGCPAIRWPRCWRSCSSCGRRSTSSPAGAASSTRPWQARAIERLRKKAGRRGVQARRPDATATARGRSARRGRRAPASCPRWWPATASSSSKRTGATSRRVRRCSSSRSPNPCEWA